MKTLATLSRWTPARAAGFARRRLDLIERTLEEIAYCYSDVDSVIDGECTELRDRLALLRSAIDEALAEGRSL